MDVDMAWHIITLFSSSTIGLFSWRNRTLFQIGRHLTIGHWSSTDSHCLIKTLYRIDRHPTIDPSVIDKFSSSIEKLHRISRHPTIGHWPLMILIGNQTLRQSGRPNYLSSTIFFGRHQHLENFDQTPIEFGLSISHWKIDLNHWSINFIQISTDHCPSNIIYLFFVEPTLRQFGWPDNRSSTISLGEFPTLRNFDQIPDESGPSISKPRWSWSSIDSKFQMAKNNFSC